MGQRVRVLILLKEHLARLGTAASRAVRLGTQGQAAAGARLDALTEGKQTDQSLRESEARFRLLAEESLAGVVVIQDGQFKYVNPVLTRMTGYSQEELLSAPTVLDVVAEEDYELMREHLRRGLEGEVRSVRVVFRARRKDGTLADLDVLGFRIVLDGRPAVMSTLLDITHQKRSQEELRESEERFRTDRRRSEEALRLSEEKFAKAFRSSPDAIVMSQITDGRLVEVNAGFERVSGFSRKEALGRSTVDLGLWFDLEERDRYFATLHESGSVREQASRFRVRSGAVLDTLVSGEILHVGQQVLALTTIRDVSGHKRAEEERRGLEAQLRQSQKMEAIGRLAGGVAHDFNNMLGVILGYADMALRKLSPMDPVQKEVAAIREAAQRSADLTRQLLAFARQQAIAPRVIDLNAQLEGMETLLQRIIGEDIALAFVLAPDAWPVSMDPSQVDQALANLAVNSRDAMPDGGRLTVETTNVSLDEVYCRRRAGARPGEYVMLAVSDTGSGMDEETRERAFEPFFTTKPEGKGTGLGLATVYGVVKQNDGFIDIYSELGHGTAVKLYLPRSKHDGVVEQAVASVAAPARGHETILLVEDEEQLRALARELLEDLGYAVLEAAGPGDALTLCEKHQGEVHMLLTDVVMPNMNGKELAARIQAMKPGIRTLFMSGYTADTIAHRGVLDVGIRFLQKPFSRDSLARKVREVLGSG